MSTFVVDVGYESEELYDSIFEDLTYLGKLDFCLDLGGSWTRAIELFKNEDGYEFEFKSKTLSPSHHLSCKVHLQNLLMCQCASFCGNLAAIANSRNGYSYSCKLCIRWIS